MPRNRAKSMRESQGARGRRVDEARSSTGRRPSEASERSLLTFTGHAQPFPDLRGQRLARQRVGTSITPRCSLGLAPTPRPTPSGPGRHGWELSAASPPAAGSSLRQSTAGRGQVVALHTRMGRRGESGSCRGAPASPNADARPPLRRSLAAHHRFSPTRRVGRCLFGKPGTATAQQLRRSAIRMESKGGEPSACHVPPTRSSPSRVQDRRQADGAG